MLGSVVMGKKTYIAAMIIIIGEIAELAAHLIAHFVFGCGYCGKKRT